MFRWLKVVCLAIALSGLPAVAQNAQSTPQWNGWFYYGPAGWKAQATAEALVFTPEQPGSLNRMRLLAPEPMQGTLSEWFMNVSRREASSYRSFHLNAVQQGSTAHGKPKIYCTGQAVTAQGQQLVISYMGIESLDGKGLLMATEFETLSSFRYLGTYGAFVRSLEPGTAGRSIAERRGGDKPAAERPANRPQPAHDSNEPAPGSRHHRETDQTDKPNPNCAPSAPQGDGAPTALMGHGLYDWFGSFYTSIMPGPNSTISQTMDWTFYRFFPNGYVYEGLPAGTDPETIACPGVVKGGRCKTYSISGNTLTIAGEKPHTFRQENGGITIDGKINNRVRRADRPMNGRWETSSGGGLMTTVTLSQHMLTLRPDGRFSIDGSTGVISPNASAYNSSALSGHYKTHGYTIELDYSNGKVVHQSFLLPYSDDKVFLIGSAMYFVPSKS